MANTNILVRKRIKKARQLISQNKLIEAQSLLQQLCNNLDDVSLLLDLAVTHRRLGEFSDAATICSRVLSTKPKLALAHHISGSVQQCLGNNEAAVASYQAALDLDPNLAEAHYFLGNALKDLFRAEEAVSAYRSAIELKPDFVEALSNLGGILIELHRLDEARTVLERANRIRPDCEQVLCNLGDLNLIEGNFKQAINYAMAVLSVNQRFPDAYYLLGKIFRKQGQYDKALKNYFKVLEFQPNDEYVIGSIAEVLEIRSEFDKARKILEPLIQQGTVNPLVLMAYSALTRNYSEEKTAVHLLEKAIEKGGLVVSNKIGMHLELGKQYDRLKEYSRAFEHYQEANRLERSLNKLTYGQTMLNQVTHKDIAVWRNKYTAEFWQGLPCSLVSSNRPIFVVGMPRSGTTLVEQILASHSNVYGAGELPDIALIEQKLLGECANTADRFKAFKQLTQRNLNRAAEGYLKILDQLASSESHVVDKMPTNFWRLGLISLMFPNAHVIHMKRDPRDNCLSIYFQQFAPSMSFASDLEELAAYYAAYVRVMDYWRDALSIRILDVRYEELVLDQDAMIRRILDFCGLEWDEQCLMFYKNCRDVNTPSYDQVRQPMYTNSIGRWRHYAQHIEPLLKKLEVDVPAS